MSLLLPAVASAQNFYAISFDGGYKYTQSSGVGLDGSLNIGISNVYISATPLNVNIRPKGNRYEARGTGWEYCLDTEQSEIVDQSHCSGKLQTLYGFSGDVNYLVRGDSIKLTFGAGYRFGHVKTPYLNIDLILNASPSDSGHYWYGNVSGGRQMLSVGFGIAFSL